MLAKFISALTPRMDEHPFGLVVAIFEVYPSLCRRGPQLTQQVTLDRVVTCDVVLVALREPLQERRGGEPGALGEIA
jgi:hypothetical protein